MISQPVTCLGHLQCPGFVLRTLGALMHKVYPAVFKLLANLAKLLAESVTPIHREAGKDMASQCKTFFLFSAAWKALGTLGISL